MLYDNSQFDKYISQINTYNKQKRRYLLYKSIVHVVILLFDFRRVCNVVQQALGHKHCDLLVTFVHLRQSPKLQILAVQ